MAEITASMVNELRKRTGAGIMECKKALQETSGDLSAAEDVIAKAGNKKAAKAGIRTAAEGRIIVAQSAKAALLLEINCETDFVAREENFVNFTQKIANLALDKGTSTLEALLEASLEGITVEEARQNLVAKIGENIQIRRLEYVTASPSQFIGSYVHNARMGSLIVLEGGSQELAKDMAMQAVANKAQYVKPEEVPSAVLDREKDILIDRAKQTGKPQEIAEKIVAGQLKKYLDEICLMGQSFFKDTDQTISSLLKSANAQVIKMVRLEVGEGIEVVKKSFEEEVMEQVRGSQA